MARRETTGTVWTPAMFVGIALVVAMIFAGILSVRFVDDIANESRQSGDAVEFIKCAKEIESQYEVGIARAIAAPPTDPTTGQVHPERVAGIEAMLEASGRLANLDDHC